MAKAKQEKSENEDPILERMNEALKRMMKTPHETQKEMIARRRQEVVPPSTAKQRKSDIEQRKNSVQDSRNAAASKRKKPKR